MHVDAVGETDNKSMDNANAPEDPMIAEDEILLDRLAKKKKLKALKRRKGEGWRNYQPVETGMPKIESTG